MTMESEEQDRLDHATTVAAIRALDHIIECPTCGPRRDSVGPPAGTCEALDRLGAAYHNLRRAGGRP